MFLVLGSSFLHQSHTWCYRQVLSTFPDNSRAIICSNIFWWVFYKSTKKEKNKIPDVYRVTLLVFVETVQILMPFVPFFRPEKNVWRKGSLYCVPADHRDGRKSQKLFRWYRWLAYFAFSGQIGFLNNGGHNSDRPEITNGQGINFLFFFI